MSIETETETVDVLVVGAGPTGLTLACDLARRGVRCRIVERAPQVPTSSRGKGIQPRTMEVLADLGVAERVLAEGWSRDVDLRWHVGGKLLADLHLPGRDPLPQVPYPNVVLLPQWRTEAVLRDRLAESGVRVELGSRLTDLHQDDTGVTATVVDVESSAARTIRSRYVVGCDGGHSTVRKALGLQLVGDTHAEHFVFGDVEISGLRRDAAHVWFDGAQYLSATPFPGQRAWQVQATVLPDADGRYERASAELFQRLFDERAGAGTVDVSHATWLSDFVSNVRMVDRYRVGRIFLAGDAAHVHSPAGGQGMNTGIQDAYNLAWKLDLVVTGRADDRLLDTYGEEREPIARSMLKGTDLGYTAVFSPHPVMTMLRERVLVPLLRLPRVQQALLSAGDQLDLNYRGSSLASPQPHRGRLPQPITRLARSALARGPHAGDRAPDAVLHTEGTHAPSRLLHHLRGPEFTLLIFVPSGCTPTTLRRLDAAADRMEGTFGRTVRARLVIAGHVRPADVRPERVILDHDGLAHRVYGAGAHAIYLIRPDGYVAVRARLGDDSSVIDYLSAHLRAHLHGGAQAPVLRDPQVRTVTHREGVSEWQPRGR